MLRFDDIRLVLGPFGKSGGQAAAGAIFALAHHVTAIIGFAGIVGHVRHIGVDILRVIGGDHGLGGIEVAHRSHSPNTMSSAPKMAVVSASIWPRDMKSIA